MVNEMMLYSHDIPAGTSSLRNLWKDGSVVILLTEYKRLKKLYNISRSSSMPKKGWDIIKNKLHAAGFTDIRTQHVIKKFASFKLQYKELREGLPVKPKVYSYLELLSEILDDDPYIEHAKPTKRMKEQKQSEQQPTSIKNNNDYIVVKFEDDTGIGVSEVITSVDENQLQETQFVNASVLLTDNESQNIEINSKNRKKMLKNKKSSTVEEATEETPSWIQYFVNLLKKDEAQKTEQLWALRQNIQEAEKVKLDALERLVHSFRKPRLEKIQSKQLKKSKLLIPNKVTNSRNIIIVDEQGSIYLKPDLKRKGPTSYVIPEKLIKTDTQVEFIDGDEIISDPPIQLEYIGDGEEIIIEQCDDEIYKVEQVYDEVIHDNVISHVEIVDQSQISEIEFIQQVEEQ